MARKRKRKRPRSPHHHRRWSPCSAWSTRSSRATDPFLGLDLQGGVSVVLQPPRTPTSPPRHARRRPSSIINQRINALGVAEAEVSRARATTILVADPGREGQGPGPRAGRPDRRAAVPARCWPAGTRRPVDRPDDHDRPRDATTTTADGHHARPRPPRPRDQRLDHHHGQASTSTSQQGLGRGRAARRGAQTRRHGHRRRPRPPPRTTTAAATATTANGADHARPPRRDHDHGQARRRSPPLHLRRTCATADAGKTRRWSLPESTARPQRSSRIYQLGPVVRRPARRVEPASADLNQQGQWEVRPVFKDGADGIDKFNAAAAKCYAAPIRPDAARPADRHRARQPGAHRPDHRRRRRSSATRSPSRATSPSPRPRTSPRP